jgi:hypothetical protein
MVIARLGPATPIMTARPCAVIEVAGTSPAMTRVVARLIATWSEQTKRGRQTKQTKEKARR